MDTSLDTTSATLNRRALLKGAGMAAVAATALGAGTASAQHEGHEGHEHHHHGGGKYAAVVKAAADCVTTAEDCLGHCIETFQKGDTTLAECAASVLELSASCTALARLGSYNSDHTKAMAAVATAICKECEAQCRKHEHHPQCKACADSCLECIKECEKLLG